VSFKIALIGRVMRLRVRRGCRVVDGDLGNLDAAAHVLAQNFTRYLPSSVSASAWLP